MSSKTITFFILFVVVQVLLASLLLLRPSNNDKGKETPSISPTPEDDHPSSTSTPSVASSTPSLKPLATPISYAYTAREIKPELAQILEDYRKFHADFSKEPGKHKYIVYVANEYAGLGNRINGLVSFFYVAVATNRVLLVKWPNEPAERFAAKYEELFQNPEGMNLDYADFVKLIGQKTDDNDIINLRNNLGAVLDVSELIGWPKNSMCAPGFALNDQVVQLGTFVNLLSLLIKNPHMQDTPINQAMDPETIYGDLFMWLARPNMVVQKKIDDLTARMTGRVPIGIQIRAGLKGFDIDAGITRSEAQVSKFWSCGVAVSKSRIRHLGGGKDAVFFIATDSPDIREKAVKVLGGNRVVFPDTSPNRGSVEGLQDAAADMFTLASCEDVIVSSRSTFGTASASLRGSARPYIVGQFGTCFQRPTAQPLINNEFSPDFASTIECWNNDMNDMDTVNAIDHSEANIE